MRSGLVDLKALRSSFLGKLNFFYTSSLSDD